MEYLYIALSSAAIIFAGLLLWFGRDRKSKSDKKILTISFPADTQVNLGGLIEWAKSQGVWTIALGEGIWQADTTVEMKSGNKLVGAESPIKDKRK